MFKLIKLNIHDVATHSFVVYLILGIIFIIPLAIITTAVSSPTPSQGNDPFFSSDVIPALIIFIFPFVYALLGTLLNTVLAVLYNMFFMKSRRVAYNLKGGTRHGSGSAAVFKP